MALDADLLVDRRRLKRRLSLWRGLAILALVAAAAAAIGRFAGLPGEAYIARYSVRGLIVDDRAARESLARIARDSAAKALIVRIDSPGGTVVGGETLYDAIRRVAKVKPVVAVMGELATSAGYMVAIAADRVFAHEGTITGSIGVIMQTAEITGLLEKLGITAEAIKSGPLKAAPSPLERMTDAVRREMQTLVSDTQQMFLHMVAERRKLGPAELAAISDGRVMVGRRALDSKLIDAIGGEREAIDWLASSKGIDKDLPVRNINESPEIETLLRHISALGQKMIFSERLTLDGLVSVWHPSLR